MTGLANLSLRKLKEASDDYSFSNCPESVAHHQEKRESLRQLFTSRLSRTKGKEKDEISRYDTQNVSRSASVLSLGVMENFTSEKDTSLLNLSRSPTKAESIHGHLEAVSDLAAHSEEIKSESSRSHWIRGHLSTYINKSKDYYYGRNSQQDDIDADFSASNISQSSRLTDFSLNSEVQLPSLLMSSSDNSLNEHAFREGQSQSAPTSRKSSLTDVSQALPFTSDETHLPLQASLQKEQMHTKKYLKPSLLTSKLTFSELLSSQKSSLTSCGPNDTCDSVDGRSPSPQVKLSLTSEGNLADNSNGDQELDLLVDSMLNEDLVYHSRPSSGSSLEFYHLWLASLLMFAYLMVPLPEYFSGFLTGCILMFLAGCEVIWLLCPVHVYETYKLDLKRFLVDAERKVHSPKGMQKPEQLQKPRSLKGWVHLATSYHGIFEKDLTKEAYVVIHEEMLFIFHCQKLELKEGAVARPRKRVKNKKQKSMEQEPVPPSPVFMFDKECRIDLKHCELFLEPADLPVRRIWNKKYPIRISAPKGVFGCRAISLTLESLKESLDARIKADVDCDDYAWSTCQEDMYLFTNTGREKEDWFYRMQLCINPLKHQVTFEDMRQQTVPREPSKSYAHYMTELMTESEKVMQRTIKGKKMEPYLAWLNIFCGRVFWDVWHEPYWRDKIAQKIQVRLSKLNTPPFITGIVLKDINLGHHAPIIHKGSLPVLDEYGVWTDLQVSYKGCFTLTLETQLNMEYYVNLVSSIARQKSAEAKDPSELQRATKMSEIRDRPGGLGEAAADIEALAAEIPVEYMETLDHVEEETESPEVDPLLADPRTRQFLESKTGKKLIGVVGWLAKSKLAKRVAETEFAKKAYEKAYEKFRKMPIILKVEVQSVKGNLAVNIPPPPTNRLWFGFRGNPVIFITASPKLGDKQVRLNYLTTWIENKLKEEFKTYFVLPSMQDVSIKLMDSHLADLYPDRPKS